jgi:hypothetical protein
MSINDLDVTPCFNGGTLDFTAVSGSSAQFSTTMKAGQIFAFTASTDCWICQGANPTAAKSAGSMFVAKGSRQLIDGGEGAKLAVLQDSAGGNASLVEVQP